MAYSEAPIKVSYTIENNFEEGTIDTTLDFGGAIGSVKESFQVSIDKAMTLHVLRWLTSKGFAWEDRVGYLTPKDALRQKTEFNDLVLQERATHPEHGYSAAHDLQEGPVHLAQQIYYYISEGRSVEAASLVLALLDLLKME